MMTFIDKVKEFHDSKFSSALFAHIKNNCVSAKETRHYQSFLNKQMRDAGYNGYKVICFNPNDSITEIDGFNPRQFAPVFMINIACRKELGKAHKVIMGTKYFDRMSDVYKKFLKV